jgi:hypothetical protein
MTKVYLYEDGDGSLYLQKEGAEEVYCHFEAFVTFGATFQQDASEIADGVEPDATVERMPLAQLEETAPPIVHLIAIWKDGKVRKLEAPGSYGELYLRDPRNFDSGDLAYDFPGG